MIINKVVIVLFLLLGKDSILQDCSLKFKLEN